MKKSFMILICWFCFNFSFLLAEDTLNHFFVFSSGYSLLHDYSNAFNSGINVGFNFEPGLIDNVNVDMSLSLYVFRDEEKFPLDFRQNYSLCHVPSVSVGPRYTVPFFSQIKPFAGAGIHLTVAVNHDPGRNETSATLGPGVYVKTGFDYIFKKFFLGIEFNYKWCFTSVPHTVSSSLRLGYVY